MKKKPKKPKSSPDKPASPSRKPRAEMRSKTQRRVKADPAMPAKSLPAAARDNRAAFSDEEQALIARIEKSGAWLEKNEWGWGFCQVADKALKLVAQIAGIKSLDLFETCDNGWVSDEGLAHVGRMCDLRHLALGPGISDAGVERLSRLSELRVLRLDSAGDVTDEGLLFLRNMKKLRELSLQYTGVEGPGLEHLRGLRQLTELNLEGTPVPGELVDSLQQAIPKCRIIWDPMRVSQKSAKASPPSMSPLKLRMTLRGGHSSRPHHAAFSPNGSMLATAEGGKVQLWDAASGEKLRRLEIKKGASFGIAFTPDGKSVVMGSNVVGFFLWNSSSGKLQKCIETEGPICAGVDVDSQGAYIAGGGFDGKVYLASLSTGKLTSFDAAAAKSLFDVQFSPDGQTLATCCADSFVSIWRIPAGTRTKELHGPPKQSPYDMIRGLAFHPEGTSLAVSHPDGFIRLWNLSTGKLIAAHKCETQVFYVAFHPGGNLLATASNDDTIVRLLDISSWKTVGEFQTNADWNSVSLLCFSPDGRTLVTNGKGSSILLLDVPGDA